MTEDQLLEAAIKACLLGGSEIMQVYAQPFKVNYKEDDSPVTEADRRASKAIVKALAPTGIMVISEEENIPAYQQRKDTLRLWLVDPLDGTKEFVKKNGEFSVNVGLIENGFPVLGAVFMPVLQEMYFASTQFGSFKMQQDVLTQQDVLHFSLQQMMEASKKLPLQRPHRYTVVASRSHLSKETYAHIEDIKRTKGETDIVYSGSSVKMCWVAEGRAHQYPRYGPYHGMGYGGRTSYC